VRPAAPGSLEIAAGTTTPVGHERMYVVLTARSNYDLRIKNTRKKATVCRLDIREYNFNMHQRSDFFYTPNLAYL
jgi:hypothetical protein